MTSASGQDTLHEGSGISHFEQLCHSLEFENHQYVKMIEDENQRITVLKTKIQEKTEETQRKNEDISRMDEQIKQLHKRFTWCKENLKCLENTRSIVIDHTTALSKELDVIKSKGAEERKTYDEQIAKYESTREDYLKVYQSFPLAIELAKKQEELANIEKKEAEMAALIKTLTQKKEEKEAFLDRKDLTRQVLKLAKLKTRDMNLEKEIHNCVVEKTRLLEQLKEIQESKDQMDHETDEYQQSKTKEMPMDIEESSAIDNPNLDATSQKEVHQSNSGEMKAANDGNEERDSIEKTGPEYQSYAFQVDLVSDFKQKNTLNHQRVDKPSMKGTMTADVEAATATAKRPTPGPNTHHYEPQDKNLHQRSYSKPRATGLFMPRFGVTPPSKPPTKPLEVKESATKQPAPEEVTPRSTPKLPSLRRFSFQTSFATREKTSEKPRSPPQSKPVTTQTSSRPFLTLSMPTFSNVPRKTFIDSTESSKLSLASKPEPKAQAPRQIFSMSKFSKSEDIQPKVSSLHFTKGKQSTLSYTHTVGSADQSMHSVAPDKPGNELQKEVETQSSQKDKLGDDDDDDGDKNKQPVFRLTTDIEVPVGSPSADFPMGQASPGSPFNLFNSRESRYSNCSSRLSSDYHPFAFGDVGSSPESQHSSEFGKFFNFFQNKPQSGANSEGAKLGGFKFPFRPSSDKSSDNEKEETVASLLNLSPVKWGAGGAGRFRLDANFDKDEDEARPMFNLF